MHARSLQKSRHFSSLVASLGFDAVALTAVHALFTPSTLFARTPAIG